MSDGRNPYEHLYADAAAQHDGAPPPLPRMPTLSLPTFSLRPGTPAPAPTPPPVQQHPAAAVNWQHLPAQQPVVQQVAVNQGYSPHQQQQYTQPAPGYAHHVQPPAMQHGHAQAYTPPQYAQPQAQPQPMYRPAPPQQQLYPAHAQRMAPQPAAQAFRPVAQAPAPRPRPALVTGSFDLSTAAPKRQITPMHVGMAVVGLVFVLVLANGSGASMRANTASLPGPVTISTDTVSGGTGVATLPLRKHSQGMPSPAAAASVGVERGGRAPKSNTQSIRMRGIPSPAAAATLAPHTLPLRPHDGMTLPRTVGERDSHASDSHYGGVSGGGGPGEAAPVMRPVMTPGEAVTAAQYHADMHQVDPYSAAPAGVNSAF